MSQTITVIRDKNEKQGLRWPDPCTLDWYDFQHKPHVSRVKVVEKIMWAGDYTLEGYEDVVCIERKGSIDELRQNLFSERDRDRASAAFEKFSQCARWTYLLVDATLAAMHKVSRYCKTPDRVRDFFYREMIARRINILWMPSPTTDSGRFMQAKELTRFMWAHVLMKDLPCSRSTNLLSLPGSETKSTSKTRSSGQSNSGLQD